MNKNVTIHLNVHSSMATLCLPLGVLFLKEKSRTLSFKQKSEQTVGIPLVQEAGAVICIPKEGPEETPGDSPDFPATPRVLLWGVFAGIFQSFLYIRIGGFSEHTGNLVSTPVILTLSGTCLGICIYLIRQV